MKKFIHLLLVVSLFSPVILFSACSTPEVQDARMDSLERRQSRMDSRTAARQERWRVRGEREDARARARFESW
jgi:hypothetical protein